jgi:hypothetical protein
VDGPQRLAGVERDGAIRQLEKIHKVRDKAADTRDHHQRTVERLSEQPGEFSGQEAGAFRAATTAVRELDLVVPDCDRQEGVLLERLQDVSVIAEPPSYAPESPFSYYADLAVAATVRFGPEVADPLTARMSSDVDMSHSAVEERLRRHSVDVALAIQKGDEYGRRCRAALSESFREENALEHRRRADAELRTFTAGGGGTATGTSNAAAFVSPAYILEAWAPFRGIARSFADQCRTWPCPDWGMNFYVPVVTGATKAGKQSEGSTVTEATPTAELETAKLETIAGMLIISQQLHDRGFTGGGAFDEVIGRQIHQQLDQEIDLYVLN